MIATLSSPLNRIRCRFSPRRWNKNTDFPNWLLCSEQNQDCQWGGLQVKAKTAHLCGISASQASANMIWIMSPIKNKGFKKGLEDATGMASILLQSDPLMISSPFYTSENPNVIFILYIKILSSRVKKGSKKLY